MRWLGLRARITIAVVAAVTGACWVLTVTTTHWAAENHLEQLGTTVRVQSGQDAEWVLNALARTPTARTYEELYEGLEKPNVGDELATEAAIIPIPSVAAGVQPQLARQYSYLNTMTELKDKVPRCLVPAGGARLEDPTIAPESSQSWNEPCDHYVFGYTLVQASHSAAVPYWLLVRAVDLTSTDDPVPELRTTLITYSLFTVLGALGLAVILAAMVARPLSRSREMAEAVASGRLEVRLPVVGHDEVAGMSAAVNTMADRLTGQITQLEQANETERRFVSDVAHELRTPTAALLASAEALEHPETRDEAAVLVVPQLRRLAMLTEDLLEISRMDAGRAHVEPSRIDLMDLVNEVIDDFGAPVGVSLVGCFPLQVSTDPARLRVIIRNLVANALQHGAPPVTIRAEANNAGVTVSVTDEGTGVPPEVRDRVFDRFVRGDEARHGSSSGLGLAIAAENARLLGGALTLDQDGRTFLLNLPG